MSERPIRIANCSGFFGDRLSAPAELLAGPDPIDVISGDYLAELTMLILWKQRAKDASTGYAATFLRQMESVLGTCLDRGVKVVTNAGGLNPPGLAERLRALGEQLGVEPQVAVVEGDDLAPRIDELLAAGETFEHLDTAKPLADAGAPPVTANAYLGGWGIADALAAGADVVVCGRVADAAVVVGPAAWWHGWARDAWDAVAGAVVAGHVLECGAQATGGNYPFLDELAPGAPGFPIAEVAADGSSVITKQPGTGGAVTTGTVTAQLLYEIAEPAYVTPDVVARFDTIHLEQTGPDRVSVTGVRGEPAPETLKVAINLPGGYRNSMTMLITGLDVEAKAEHALTMLFDGLGGREQFDEVDVQLFRTDRPDAPTTAEATAQLRVTVKDRDPQKVGRRFSNAVTELALASYAGFFMTSPPGKEAAYGVYWPALVPAGVVEQTVVLPDGTRVPVEDPPRRRHAAAESVDTGTVTTREGPTERVPLGAVCGARSGDKGGNANLGLWTRTDDAYRWLASYLTPDKLRELLTEAEPLEIRRYELPNIRALNFVIVGLLGEGVASSTRFDAQAKSLGEYVRSRIVDVPKELVP